MAAVLLVIRCDVPLWPALAPTCRRSMFPRFVSELRAVQVLPIFSGLLIPPLEGRSGGRRNEIGERGRERERERERERACERERERERGGQSHP